MIYGYIILHLVIGIVTRKKIMDDGCVNLDFQNGVFKVGDLFDFCNFFFFVYSTLYYIFWPIVLFCTLISRLNKKYSIIYNIMNIPLYKSSKMGE